MSRNSTSNRGNRRIVKVASDDTLIPIDLPKIGLSYIKLKDLRPLLVVESEGGGGEEEAPSLLVEGGESQKISALTTKTTFGDNDFLAGTQGTGAGDNRKYGIESITNGVLKGFNLAVYEISWNTNSNPSVGLAGGSNSSISVSGISNTEFTITNTDGNVIFPIYLPISSNHEQFFDSVGVSGDTINLIKLSGNQMFGYLFIFTTAS